MIGVGRKPQNLAKVPFKEILGLKLKNEIKAKGTSGRDVICIHEMALLLSCLNTHNYTEEPCNAEITSFQKCFDEHQGVSKAQRKKKEKDTKNKMLKMYPNL